jgi:hypothetical protein
MSENENRRWWMFDEDEEELKRYCLPFEEIRRITSQPYVFGQFRWFRAENVCDLERYRRHRARQADAA